MITQIVNKLNLKQDQKIQINIAVKNMQRMGYLTLRDFKFQLSEYLPGVFNSLLNVTGLSDSEVSEAIANRKIKSDVLDKVFKDYYTSIH